MKESSLSDCAAFIEQKLNELNCGCNHSIYFFSRMYQDFFRPIKSSGNAASLLFGEHASSQFEQIVDIFNGKTLFCKIICAAPIPRVLDTRTSKRAIESIEGLLWFLYERSFSINLLVEMQKPIDYYQDSTSFYKSMMQITLAASGMYAAALREYDAEAGTLTALFAYHPDLQHLQLESWDIAFLSELEQFQNVVATRSPTVIVDTTGHKFFLRDTQLHIKSAVFCPVLVGSDVFGIISFAQKVAYQYSPTEINGFMAVANAVGVAIANFRHSASHAERIGDQFTLAGRLTAVEVAQAARHSAKGALSTAQLNLANVLLDLRKLLSSKEYDQKRKEIDLISQNLSDVTKALDDIKAATKPPKKEKMQFIEVDVLWKDCVRQLHGKLVKENIAVKNENVRDKIYCYPDYVRQLLLNLLINSIDAFAAKSAKQGRKISLRRDDVANPNFVTMIYSDNAGGLDVRLLQQFVEQKKMDVAQVIFEQDVTTKGDEGSGWGLYLCRRVLKEHEGSSIDVVDWKRGMTFAIRFRRMGED